MEKIKFYALACTGGDGSDWQHVGFAKDLPNVKKMLKQIKSSDESCCKNDVDAIDSWDIENEDEIELLCEVFQYFFVECSPLDTLHYSFIWEEENPPSNFGYFVNWNINVYIEFAKMKCGGKEPSVKLRDFESFESIEKIEKYLELIDLDSGLEAYVYAEEVIPPTFSECDFESEFL